MGALAAERSAPFVASFVGNFVDKALRPRAQGREARDKVCGAATLLALLLAFAPQAQAVENVATTNGNWESEATWSAGVPGTTHDVVIPTGVTVTMNGLDVREINSLTITGTLTHAVNGNYPTPGEQHKIILEVETFVMIAAGGKIDVSEKGYAARQGPGAGSSRGGGGHGGEGGWGYGASARGKIYGSITNPVNIGSGSSGWDAGTGYEGGGAIVLTISGAVTNNGLIAAAGRGTTANNTIGGGAGGSINLTAASLAGSGQIMADGGRGGSNASGGGSGGRVAVKLTQSGADFSSFPVANITANGGWGGGGYDSDPGAGGTVYLKTADQTYGELIVGNDNLASLAVTPLTNSTFRFDAITTTNYGVLQPGADAVLDLTGCTLHSDSTTNSIASRLIIGTAGSTVLWPSAFTNAATISWTGTNWMSVTSDLTVASGGILTHEVGQTHRIALDIDGDLTIAEGGAIWVAGRGNNSFGLGGGTGRAGGSHGGLGGRGHGSGTALGITYGSITNPVLAGSGGGGQAYGGGVLLLRVTDALTVDGVVSADGVMDLRSNPCTGGGAGGSINIRVSSIAGSGAVTARGGAGSDNATGGGGGGRIAVTLTDSADFGAVSFSTMGGVHFNGTTDGGAGTIYLKGTNAPWGALIVNNNRTVAESTLVSTNVTDIAVGEVFLLDKAKLAIAGNVALTVYGSWSNAVGANALSGPGSVIFAGSDTATLFGDTTFNNFVCQVPGKTLRFEAGKTQIVTTGLTLTGADGNLLVLESADPAEQWTLSALPGSTQHDVSYLSVNNSIAGADTITATFSDDKGGNENWIFSNPSPIVWTGNASTDWNTPGNWDLGRVPLQGDQSITIPTPSGGNPSNWPALDKTYLSPGYDGDLIVESGATLNLAGHSLRIGGDVTVAGTMTATGSQTLSFEGDVDFTGGTFNCGQSTLRLAGTGVQALTTGGNTFHILDIANTAAITVTGSFTTRDLTFPATSADVSFGGGFTATDMRLLVTDGASLTFGAGQTYTINNQLLLRGASGYPIVLTGAGSWNLNANGYATVRHASVDDSNASGGRTIYAVDSTDNSGNLNWNFGDGKVWIGTDTSWATAANWSPPGAPTFTNVVLIDGSAAAIPRLQAGTTIAGLSVVGVYGPASLTVDMPFAGPDTLTVNGDIDIGVGGGLTHTQGNETHQLALHVGGNLMVAAGGTIDVSAKGFSGGQGPGVANNRGGAGHGGEGGWGFQVTSRGKTYGAVGNPTRSGSGASVRKGGGVVILQVQGAAFLDGTISANGENETAYTGSGGGAGGSINLKVGSLSGSGSITAAGGHTGGGSGGGGGGGGRIAVLLNDGGAGFDTFAVANIAAFGGNYKDGNWSEERGAAGTVCLQTAAQGTGSGVVTINNANQTTGARTQLPPAVSPTLDELRNAAVIVTNRGALAITASDQIASLTVASANEPLTLGATGTVLTVDALTVHGTAYTKAGLYTATDWNGLSAPAGVTGDGAILIQAKGSLFLLR